MFIHKGVSADMLDVPAYTGVECADVRKIHTDYLYMIKILKYIGIPLYCIFTCLGLVTIWSNNRITCILSHTTHPGFEWC